MNRDRLEQLRDLYRDTLLDDVLPFWLSHGLDHEHAGYYTALDRDGSLLDSDKGIWVQGRFAWLLSHLNQQVGHRAEWSQAAAMGLDFLDRHGTDPADGLMWFHVTENGRPLRKRRYRFSEAFACLANAASFQATGDSERAAKAASLFATFDTHLRDSSLSPFAPKFTATRPTKGIGGPMIGINLAQTCRAAGIEGDWEAAIDRYVDEIRTDFVRDEIECVMETVAVDGALIDEHFDGRTLNPGHAIEAAWFILEEARHRNDEPQLVSLGMRMLDWMWRRGWDEEFGGLLYFVGVDERPTQEYWHDMKFWWPHNEAIVATLMAYLITGERRYADWHQQVHDWSFSHFPDPDYGEWFGYLRRDGSVSNPLKGNLWKGPFHLPRMLHKGWQLVEEALQPFEERPGNPENRN